MWLFNSLFSQLYISEYHTPLSFLSLRLPDVLFHTFFSVRIKFVRSLSYLRWRVSHTWILLPAHTWLYLTCSVALYVFCKLSPDAEAGIRLWFDSLGIYRRPCLYLESHFISHLSFHDVTITIDATCPGLLIYQGLLHCDSPILGFFPHLFVYCWLYSLLLVLEVQSLWR